MRTIQKSLLLVMTLFCTFGCASKEQLIPEDENLTEGMISSSTYQVMVAEYAAKEEEARANGEQNARRKMYTLLLREPFFRGTLSEDGKHFLRLMIEQKGKITQMTKQKDNSYLIVFQMTQAGGLRNTFRNIR